MANDLIEVRAQLQPVLEPYQEIYGDLLRPMGMDPERMINSCMIACMKTPKLRQCPAHTVANAVMTGAVLGLEMDGVTGQGYIIPRWNGQAKQNEAQFQPGYKGGVTTAARAGFTVNMAVVREGDAFEYMLGTSPEVMHKPKLGDEDKRKIIGAYATATSPNSSPYVEILSYDQLLDTKNKSMSAQKGGFSPWNTHFDKMAAKTASLRLRLPHVPVMQFNQHGLAAAVDMTTEERGLNCHITQEGALLTEQGPMDVQPPPAENPATRPEKLRIFKNKGDPVVCMNEFEYREKMGQALAAIQSVDYLKQFHAINKDTINGPYKEMAGEKASSELMTNFEVRLEQLQNN